MVTLLLERHALASRPMTNFLTGKWHQLTLKMQAALHTARSKAGWPSVLGRLCRPISLTAEAERRGAR
jgi:hypothetical protein